MDVGLGGVPGLMGITSMVAATQTGKGPQQPDVSPAGPIVAAVPAVATAIGLPAALAAGLGAAAGYFLGEWDPTGGGGGGKQMIGPVPLGGPGLPEPPAGMVAKEWKIRFDSKQGDFNVQYYQLRNGRMVTYNQRTGQYKTWKPYKMVVIGKKIPSHQQITRLRRYLKKHQSDAKTILQITNPTAYARQLGYKKHKRRR